MRKILIIFMLLAIGDISFAKYISQYDAMLVAQSFEKVTIPVKSASTISIAYEAYPSDSPSQYHSPSCYIFNYSTGGYIIVAANDVARPILAYCKSGSFNYDTSPNAEKEWLDVMSNAIYHASKSSIIVTDKTKSEWVDYLSSKAPQRGEEVVLETASWSQGAPYNNMICEVLGKECPTGCVATAGAIAMRYYKHPNAGKGVCPGYSTALCDIGDYELGSNYNWEEMPMAFESGEYTEYQARQVSQLMYDIGVSVKSKYTTAGTSSTLSNLLKAMRQYFDYDPNIELLTRDYLRQTNADERFESVIKNEIDEKRLVIMEGKSSKTHNGHAFIICGYSGDYFCVNWGWGTADWYGLITPVDGYDDQMMEYSIDQSIIFNIRPNEGGVGGYPIVFARNIEFSTWHYKKNSPFLLKIGIDNAVSTLPEYDIEATYALIDENRKIKEIIKKEPITMYFATGRWSWHSDNLICEVTKDFSETDSFALCYRIVGEDNWTVADWTLKGELSLKPKGNLTDIVSLYFVNNEYNGFYYEDWLYFLIPSNIAVDFKRSDGAVLGDSIAAEGKKIEGAQYKYDGFYSSRKTDNEYQLCNKMFWAASGQVWEVTLYDIRDSYTFTIKF